MSRRKRYISELNEEQKSSLENGYKFGDSPIFRRKCHCILLSHSGKSVSELQQIFGVSKQSLYSWFNQWENQGIDGLALQPGRGRKPKLHLEDTTQVEFIKTLVENDPKDLKQVVSKLNSDLGIDLSKKTLKRFLKNLTTDGSALEKD